MIIETVSKLIIIRLLLLVLLINLFLPDTSAARIQTPAAPPHVEETSFNELEVEMTRRIKRSPKGGGRGGGGRGGGGGGGMGRGGGRAVGLGNRPAGTRSSSHSARESFQSIMLPFSLLAPVIAVFNKHIT